MPRTPSFRSGFVEFFHEGAEPENIAVGPETAYLADADRGDIGEMTERFALVDVGDVHFDGRKPDGTERVAQRCLSLPISPMLRDEQIKRITGAMRQALA